MSVGPTSGARDPVDRSWAATSTMAWVVRVLVAVGPVVAGWFVVRAISGSLFRPEGWAGVAAWVVQAAAVASVVATVVARVAQKALPLATLMGMSLTFPDQAPSRFSLALRTGSLRQLRARVEEVQTEGLGGNAQEAAVRAVEMVTMLGRHERLTRGHTDRVRAYAEVIAVELGLSDDDRQMLAWGVFLHDIGKLTVPPEILNKNGPPTAAEWDILQRHPAEGGKIVEPLMGWLGDWGRAAAEHHERWDGGGYPRGLQGLEISLAGRITAVADAYDVITSRRSYKVPLSVEAARQELVDCAGIQFDPDVVRAFLQASVRREERRAGFLSWIPELPGLATIAQTAASAPAAAAVALVAVSATVSGIGTPTAPPSSLALTEPSAQTAPSLTTIELDVPAVDVTNPTELTTTTDPGVSTTTAESTTTTAKPTTTTAVPTTTVPTTTTTTTVPTTTTTQPAGPYVAFLTNPGIGNTSSDSPLALTFGPVDDAQLPNYDTDRDGDPGLSMAKDGDGLATNDATKHQDWVWVAPAPTTLSGPATLTVYVSAKDLEGGETIGVTAGIYICSPACTRVGTGNWTAASLDGEFSDARISFGSLDHSLATGDQLVVKVAAPDNLTDTDIYLAYDTTTYPSRIRIG